MKLLCAKLHNGVLLPAVGLGTWELPNSPETRKAIEAALLRGYRHIDTASAYHNEETVGEAVNAYEAQDPKGAKDEIHVAGNFVVIDEIEFRGNMRVPHADVNKEARTIFVTTKVSTSELAKGAEGIEACFQNHLEHLKRSCADLVLLHFPAAAKVAHNDPSLPGQRIAAWKVMEQLYKEGKCRAIGVSNYMIHHLKPLIEDIKKRKYAGDLNATVPMVNQIEFSPYCQCDPDLIALCQAERVVLESYSTLGSATGKEQLLSEPVVRELATKKNVPPSAIVLRWALERNFVVIPRSRNALHIEENLKCLYFNLSREEEESITKFGLEKPQRFCWDPTKVN